MINQDSELLMPSKAIITKSGENRKDDDYLGIALNVLRGLFKNPWETPSITPLMIEITEEKIPLRFRGKCTGYGFGSDILLTGNRVPLASFSHINGLTIQPNKKYEILFKYKLQGIEKTQKVPPIMNQNLLNYLAGGRRENECCMDFVNALLFGCKTQQLNSIILNGSRSYFIDDSLSLTMGQTIAIGDNTSGVYEPKHFAIYIADGLFLSVMGNDTPLMITTLDQMKAVYNYPISSVIFPLLDSQNSIQSTHFTLN